MLPVPFLLTNDVIMTSLLFLKIIYVFANFLNFIRDLILKYSLYVYPEGNFDFANKFNNMTL